MTDDKPIKLETFSSYKRPDDTKQRTDLFEWQFISLN